MASKGRVCTIRIRMENSKKQNEREGKHVTG